MQYFCASDAQMGCYFSYSIDLSNRIQNWFDTHTHHKKEHRHSENNHKSEEEYNEAHFKENCRFVWNTHLLHPALKTCRSYEFLMPIICGFVDQQTIDIQERHVSFGVISRRSRFQGGPRFLRRGLNSEGDVANEVETDQFLYEQHPFQPHSFRILAFTMVLLT